MINPVEFPRLVASGILSKEGSKPVPAYTLDWNGFPAEAGPDGCSTQRFALGNVVQQKLRDLCFAAALASNDHLGRRAAGPCVLALAGCIRAVADLLSDCAIDSKTSSWASPARKEALAAWIALRIWRKVDPKKSVGFKPESLISVKIDGEKGKVMRTVKTVRVIKEKFAKDADGGPPFEYRAIVEKDGRLYRVRISMGMDPSVGIDDLSMARLRTEEGKVLTATVAMDGPDGHDILVIDDEAEQEYHDVEEFLEDWVFNGMEQAPGMVSDLGEAPGLFPKPASFKYSCGFLRSYPTVKDEDDDGLYRSVAIFPAPKGLRHLIEAGGEAAIIEEGDVFVDRKNGQWFSVLSIHDEGDGPSFHLSSANPADSLSNPGSTLYPYDDESTEADVNLDGLLSGYVCMSDVDSAAKGCELVVTRTVKGKDCIAVLLSKGPKAMQFRIGDDVPGQSKIVALKDDRAVFRAADGVEYAETYESLADRVGYWDEIKAPGIPVPPEEQEGGPSEEFLEDCLKNLEESPPCLPSTSYEKGGPVGVKVGDLAKEFGVPSKVVIERLRALNIEAKNASTILKPGQADRVRAKMENREKRS